MKLQDDPKIQAGAAASLKEWKAPTLQLLDVSDDTRSFTTVNPPNDTGFGGYEHS